jgi:hypothetical protein
MDDMISTNEAKSPHRRDFLIAGVKTRIPDHQTEILAIPDLRDRGIRFADSLAVLATRHHERERPIESEDYYLRRQGDCLSLDQSSTGESVEPS